MAVTIQAGSIATYFGGVGTPTLYKEITVNVSAGSNLAVYLFVTMPFNNIDGDGNWDFANPPSMDGTPMTAVRTAATGANNNTAIWRALAPSAGAHALRIYVEYWAGTVFMVTGFCAEGVDQTTPEGTIAVWDDVSSTSPMSVSVTCDAGGMVVAGAGCHSVTAGTLANTGGSGQTDLAGVQTTASRDLIQVYKADAASISFSFTGGGQGHIVALPINPAAGGGGGGDPLLVPPIALVPQSVATGRASNF